MGEKYIGRETGVAIQHVESKTIGLVIDPSVRISVRLLRRLLR